jgi:glucoamylase
VESGSSGLIANFKSQISNFKSQISNLFRVACCLLPFAFAQAQQGLGTSVLSESKVWFTLQDGMLSQVNYPNLKTNNLTSLYFVVTDGKTFAVSERDADVTKQFANTNPRALSFQQINIHTQRKFTLTKRYCAYPDYSTVLIDVELRAPTNYKLYVVFDPALANTEANDTAAAFGGQGAFSVYEGDVCAALIADKGFTEMSVEAVGANDGLQRLLRHFKLTKPSPRADQSNVLCVARIRQPKHFLLALSFADTPEKALIEAEHCLEADFADTLADYEKGWSDWLKTNADSQPFLPLMLRKAREEK